MTKYYKNNLTIWSHCTKTIVENFCGIHTDYPSSNMAKLCLYSNNFLDYMHLGSYLDNVSVGRSPQLIVKAKSNKTGLATDKLFILTDK